MENRDLDNGESVIHTTQRLIINGTGYDAAFTDKRLILTDAESGTIRIAIPYTDIVLASAETNKIREPVIRITYEAADGITKGIELIFIFLAAGRNIQNRDNCLGILEKKNVSVEHDPHPADYFSRSKREQMDAGTLDSEQTGGRPPVPEWTVYGPAQGNRQALPDEPKPLSPLLTLVIVFLLAVILIGAMTAPIPEPSTPSWLKTGSPAAATSPTGASTMAPTPEIPPDAGQTVTVPEPQETLQETITLGGVPVNGIWIKISYPGAYSGFLAAGGLRTEVNSSGTQLFQMPVQNTVIDILIEKKDGSGDPLEIGVYNGGEPVSNQGTSTPFGVLEMHVPVGTAITRTAAVPVTTTITSVPAGAGSAGSMGPIPQNGVFVRVVYPGQYHGTISGNGFARDVNSSGDQVFQLSLASGNVDAFLEKDDGSVRNMQVQVFRNGELVTSADTSTPLGTVEIHTTV